MRSPLTIVLFRDSTTFAPFSSDMLGYSGEGSYASAVLDEISLRWADDGTRARITQLGRAIAQQR